MLAAEEEQRQSLDALLQKSLAVGRHIELDRRLSELNAENTAITESFRTSFAGYEKALEDLMLVRLSRLVETASTKEAAPGQERQLALQTSRLLSSAEADFSKMADVQVEITRALLARADLKLGGITRQELETKIEEIAAKADVIEAGLVGNRALVDEILATHTGQEDR